MAKLIQKGKRFYLQGTFENKQRQVALGTDNAATAKEKAKRFEATALMNGLEDALDELQGKQREVRKNGAPDFEGMERLYRGYLSQCPLGPRTVRVNLNSLKRCMKACGPTVLHLDADKVRKALLAPNPNESQRRTFASIIRAAKSVFKKRALAYYLQQGLKLVDPFAGLEMAAPKPTPYKPISEAARERIWDNAAKELEASCAMIVLLGLGAAMRRAEIEAARLDWFSLQADTCLVAIQAEDGFQVKDSYKGRLRTVAPFKTKSGETRVVPITKELWAQLLDLRGESKSPFLIPRSGARLGREFELVTQWLKGKGVKDDKALHAMRKEAGSLISKNRGILEASRFLGHADTKTTSTHYSGVEMLHPVAIRPADPIASFAALQGVKVEELRKWLAEQKKVS